jgi:hypothetical protein
MSTVGDVSSSALDRYQIKKETTTALSVCGTQVRQAASGFSELDSVKAIDISGGRKN